MHHRTWSLLAALVLALTLALAACGGDGGSAGKDSPGSGSGGAQGPGSGKPVVRFGTKNFTEQYVLGELYAQALRARGWHVEVKRDIGATEVIDQALASGVIDVYPEYTGTALTVVKGQDALPRSEAATWRDAKRFYERRGQDLLARTPFEDRDALAVTRDFARRHGGLRSMTDLGTLGRLTLAAAPEFRTRFAGLLGLRSEYGLRYIAFKPLSIDEVYKALDAGTVDVGDVFTTAGQLASGRYVVLHDPKAIFGVQNVAPVVAKGVLKDQGPEFARTLDRVSATLTNEDMQRMNAAVALKGRTPAEVARAFLTGKRLL